MLTACAATVSLEVIFIFQYSSELPKILLFSFTRGSEDAVNLDLCNFPSGTYKVLQLKEENTCQASPDSVEGFASRLGLHAVPSITLL